MSKKLIEFIEKYENKVSPIFTKYNDTFFKASISGNAKLYKEAANLEIQLSKIHSEKNDFKYLDSLIKSGEIKDPVLKRELDVLYRTYKKNQVDPELLEEIILSANKIEEIYSTFRANIAGEKLSDNEIDLILKNSIDSKKLKSVWEASKQIGEEVEQKVISLVKLRNKMAADLGYDNFHEMSLELDELSYAQLDYLFDDLEQKIKPEFIKIKSEIDAYISTRLNIAATELMPWHYEDKFFQQGPEIYDIDFDVFFKGKNIVALTSKFFKGIGLEIDDLIKNSDLFEKEGKYQHAYCMHVDKSGDVRVLCNIKDDYRWAGTMLHEFGHAVYDKYIDMNLPWHLREPAHIFTTEAIAMLFGRMAADTNWLNKIANVNKEKAKQIENIAFKKLKLEQLVFSRWVQVVYRFEKEMYANPEQDLNLLWKNLVEKYQLLKYPENRNKPDWAAKIHIALYPAYYQNYMLGELLASQLFFYISNKILGTSDFIDRVEVGNFLKENFFKYGALLNYNELIEKSTKGNFTVDSYIKQFTK